MLLVSLSMNALASGSLCFAPPPTANPPFEFISKVNQLVGLDIDLAKAICLRLRTKCVFISSDFSLLLSSLKFGCYDAAISGMDITDVRLKQVDFIQPCLLNAGAIIAVKNCYSSLEQLKGKRMGCETTQQVYLQSEWRVSPRLFTIITITRYSIFIMAGWTEFLATRLG